MVIGWHISHWTEAVVKAAQFRPSLFAIGLEPLANTLQQSDFSGIGLGL